MFKKILSFVLVIMSIVTVSGIFTPYGVMAASITSATDTLTRLAASTAANHELKFVIPNGLTSGQTLTLTFSGFTGVSGILYTDVDLAEGSTSNCTSASFTEKTIDTTPSGTTWGAGSAGSTITFTAGSTGVGLFTANKCARIRIGTNATVGQTGVNQISNGSTGTATIAIAGTMTDSGTISIPIIDSDQVSITATVNETVTFDIDVGTTTGETSTPYAVPLGTLSTSSVTHSDNSTIKSIYLDGTTNATGGLNVTVNNTNGADGLVSTSATGDKIPSATTTMAAGTANYGLCVVTSTLTGWAKSATYTTTCATNSSTNGVVALSASPTSMLTSTAPLSNGHAEVSVNAAIASTTPGHSDYSDALTFIATGSF